MAKAKAKSFEEQMDLLELAVRRLEQEELSLDEMLKLYAQGVELVRVCRDRLTAARSVLAPQTEEEEVEA